MQSHKTSSMSVVSVEQIYEWLQEVTDPEVPVLTILDLGIVREVHTSLTDAGAAKATIIITATYSGCPAMDVIGMNIRMALMSHGIPEVVIEQRISPAWTTDWMTDTGKEKLKAYGIAPPQRKSTVTQGIFEEEIVPCPKCGSEDTTEVSRFGATACKSMFKCNNCKEPFEHFKCH